MEFHEACVIKIKGENGRHIVLIESQIMVEKHKGRIYVRPFNLKEIGEFKEIRRTKISWKFAAAMENAFAKNELMQVHLEEFDAITEIN